MFSHQREHHIPIMPSAFPHYSHCLSHTRAVDLVFVYRQESDVQATAFMFLLFFLLKAMCLIGFTLPAAPFQSLNYVINYVTNYINVKVCLPLC